jgi:septal ring factor EnvC (AmiA/AmiB activator)
MAVTLAKSSTIADQIRVVNSKYKQMQQNVLKLMTHPDATPEDIETARKLLIDTASALVEARAKFAKAGYEVDRLEGITKKYRFF